MCDYNQNVFDNEGDAMLCIGENINVVMGDDNERKLDEEMIYEADESTLGLTAYCFNLVKVYEVDKD